METTQGIPTQGVPDDVSIRTKRWQWTIYFVCFITLSFGIITLAIATKYLTAGQTQSTIYPDWALKLAISFGAIVAVISFLGMYGARKAPDHIENGTRNYSLILFFLILLIGIIIQIIIAAVILNQLNILQNTSTSSFSTSATSDVDSKILTFIHNYPNDWIDIQNHFACCGYNSTNTTTDPTATSPIYCGTVAESVRPPIPPCRQKLLNELVNDAKIIGALAVVFSFLEIGAFISSCCLLYCIKRN